MQTFRVTFKDASGAIMMQHVCVGDSEIDALCHAMRFIRNEYPTVVPLVSKTIIEKVT